jgi:hypothetical protein
LKVERTRAGVFFMKREGDCEGMNRLFEDLDAEGRKEGRKEGRNWWRKIG